MAVMLRVNKDGLNITLLFNYRNYYKGINYLVRVDLFI